jgi:guanylate kinase
MSKLAPLIVLSGPSGSGKSTVIERLLGDKELPLHLAVSATTRKPRPGEKDGVHYFFWSPEKFQDEVDKGAFLEWAEVFGNRYGTLKSEVDAYRHKGVGVLLEIDVKGWEQVRDRCPDAVSVFLQAPSLETYEKRLRDRGTETEAVIQRRIAGAKAELARAGDYDYQVVNDDLDRAVKELKEIIRKQFDQ